jgi:hypothetical protein
MRTNFIEMGEWIVGYSIQEGNLILLVYKPGESPVNRESKPRMLEFNAKDNSFKVS